MSRARKEMGETPDREIEAHLRQGAGREWIEEAAEDERLTELLRRRRLNLSDRAREMMHRGERARAETGSDTFSGHVVASGSEFATIDRGDDVVDVVLDAAVWTVEPSDAGGMEQSGSPLTFRARLSELAAQTDQARVVVRDGRAIMGTIEVVATDHVEIAQDGNTVIIPIRVIAAVIHQAARR